MTDDVVKSRCGGTAALAAVVWDGLWAGGLLFMPDAPVFTALFAAAA